MPNWITIKRQKMQIWSDKRHFSIHSPLSIMSALVCEPLRREVNVLQPQKKIFTSLAILLSKIEFFKREIGVLLWQNDQREECFLPRLWQRTPSKFVALDDMRRMKELNLSTIGRRYKFPVKILYTVYHWKVDILTLLLVCTQFTP